MLKENKTINIEGCNHPKCREILDAIPTSIIISDKKTGNIVVANEIASSSRGYSREEFNLLTISQIKKDANYEEEIKNLEEKGIVVFEAEHIRKNGTVFPVRINANLVGDFVVSTVSDIAKQKRDEEKTKRKLEFAGRVQRELLPKMINNDFIEMKSIFEAADSVSGDFYNFNWNEKAKILNGFLVDVRGHGLESAIHTSAINTTMKRFLDEEISLLEKIKKTDEIIKEDNLDVEYFAGALYFKFDFKNNVMQYCSAGIPYILTSAEKNNGSIRLESNFVGMVDDPEFISGELSFVSGNNFYFATDGITDLLNLSKNNHIIVGLDNFDYGFKMLSNVSKRRKDDATALCVRIK